MSWLATCLMMIPYPRLVENAGANMAAVYALTAVFSILALIAAFASWLLMRRHALRWAGQLVLLVAIAVALGWWFGT